MKCFLVGLSYWKSVSYVFTLLLFLPGKGHERKKLRRQKKQSEIENGRKTLRFVCLVDYYSFTCKWQYDNFDFGISEMIICTIFFRKQEMAVWTVGGTSRPKARPRRKRTGLSSNLLKLRWNRGNDAVKWDFT